MFKALIITQICRRFGPVGGMERYVWELCRELANAGHQVHVLCETNLCKEALPELTIHELGIVRPKPRWLAHIRFSRRVHAWLEQHRTDEMIIHSHERCRDHHITTFHGPPFAQIREAPIWKRFSLRVNMSLWLEKRELCSPKVQIIVPNSIHIRQQLAAYYPAITRQLMPPVAPGVSAGGKRPMRHIATDAGVIGFVGKEWKRKGLKKAIQIVNTLAETRENISFVVAGPLEKNIHSLFESSSFKVTLLGEVNTKELYPQMDVLLHPAINEPYGMVVTEALSAGVPVVISDVCGAASEVTPQRGRVLSLNENDSAWAQAIESCLNEDLYQHIHYQRSWYDVALAYNKVYQTINT